MSCPYPDCPYCRDDSDWERKLDEAEFEEHMAAHQRGGEEDDLPDELAP